VRLWTNEFSVALGPPYYYVGQAFHSGVENFSVHHLKLLAQKQFMYLQQTTLLVINITSLLNTNISNSNLVLYFPFKMHCLYNVSPQIVNSVSIYSCSCFAIVVPTIIPCCFSLFVEHCLFPTATIYHHIYHFNYYSFFSPTSSFF